MGSAGLYPNVTILRICQQLLIARDDDVAVHARGGRNDAISRIGGGRSRQRSGGNQNLRRQCGEPYTRQRLEGLKPRVR